MSTYYLLGTVPRAFVLKQTKIPDITELTFQVKINKEYYFGSGDPMVCCGENRIEEGNRKHVLRGEERRR